MSTFIESNTQAVIGNKYLPQRVIQGPAKVFLWRRRVFGQFSTIPQWLTFTSQELITVTQIPVIFQIDCNWSRNLLNLNQEQLLSAMNVSNAHLEVILRKNLELQAKNYVSHYRIDDLVATYETNDHQLTITKHTKRHLESSLLEDMKKSFRGFGLLINKLAIIITLPDRLRQEVEYLWRLQKCQGQMDNLTDLKLAEAVTKSQPTLNLLISKLPEKINNHYGPVAGVETVPLSQPQKSNGNGVSKKTGW